MRGRRRTVAAVLADALASRPGAGSAALAAAFADACGPRLAREASFRGVARDGRLLVVVRSAAWATQVAALEREICDAVNARLRRPAAPGLDVRIAPEAQR
jgi:ABC-type amino acid transport substrate-binding protein